MGTIGGQASGDFRLSSSALRILYSYVRDSIGVLSADSFTQSNPSVVTAPPGARSTTLPVNVKLGVLSGSVAFVRPDQGANIIGGARLVSGDFVIGTRPIGLFINDAVGNAYENTPGVASGKGPVLRGGSCGDKIYETAVQTVLGGGVPGTALVYTVGNLLYGSANGLLTNRWQDSYEAQWIDANALGSGPAGVAIEPDVTRAGLLISPPDATSSEMFLALYL